MTFRNICKKLVLSNDLVLDIRIYDSNDFINNVYFGTNENGDTEVILGLLKKSNGYISTYLYKDYINKNHNVFYEEEL